jgi:predicted  nucleic acid-binding Zn-ribbon protein
MEEFSSLEDLLDLQVVDLEIDRLLDRRQNLDELERYRTAHERLTAIEGEIAGVSDRLRDIELAIDKAEGELQLGEQKLEREERRLFAGGLSAREADHLRQEVEMLGRQNGELEDQTLSLMEQREQTQTESAGLEEQRRAAQGEKDHLETAIKALWSEIDADIARYEEKKEGIVPLIQGELLELYEQLRPTKEGVAVGRLAEGICGGCHLALSAAEQSEVMRDHPPRCLHCLRILVPQ